MDSNGQLCWEPTSIRNIASSYYEKLLTAEPLSEQVRDCRSHIWAEVRNMVLIQMNCMLDAPFRKNELNKALSSLPRNNALERMDC